jgi:hypothetical protein
MQPISYRRHQFPPEIIRQTVWLYLRFTLSYRDVEELLAERGLDISYETVRESMRKCGATILLLGLALPEAAVDWARLHPSGWPRHRLPHMWTAPDLQER